MSNKKTTKRHVMLSAIKVTALVSGIMASFIGCAVGITALIEFRERRMAEVLPMSYISESMPKTTLTSEYDTTPIVQGTFPQSGITLPNRHLTPEERADWIAEYWEMGGPFAFELEVVRLINEVRLEHDLAYLQIDYPLMMAARFYSQIMANFDTNLNHNEGPYRIVASVNHSHNASRAVAEAFGGSLRWNGGNGGAGDRNTAQSLVSQWMRSPNHRAFILFDDHRYIGVGSHVGGLWGAFQYLFLSDVESNCIMD